MKRFQNILLVVSQDEDGQVALHTAVNLALKNKGRLSMIEVLQPMKWPDGMMILYESIQKAAVTTRLSVLRELAAPHCGKDFEIQITVTVGSPCQEVTRQVLKEKHDLIVRNTVGHHARHDAIRLMRKCPCPVWGVKSKDEGQYECILACVDPDLHHPNRHALNDTILELAISKAEEEQAELHVLHCYDVFKEDVLIGAAKLNAYEAREHIQAIEEGHRKTIDDLLGNHDFSRVDRHIHVLQGQARDVIPQWVKDHGADLIVMGSICRTGLAGFFIGNTAESILRQVDCSTLTLKPPDFKSPVKTSAEDVYHVSEWVAGPG